MALHRIETTLRGPDLERRLGEYVEGLNKIGISEVAITTLECGAVQVKALGKPSYKPQRMPWETRRTVSAPLKTEKCQQELQAAQEQLVAILRLFKRQLRANSRNHNGHRVKHPSREVRKKIGSAIGAIIARKGVATIFEPDHVELGLMAWATGHTHEYLKPYTPKAAYGRRRGRPAPIARTNWLDTMKRLGGHFIPTRPDTPAPVSSTDAPKTAETADRKRNLVLEFQDQKAIVEYWKEMLQLALERETKRKGKK